MTCDRNRRRFLSAAAVAVAAAPLRAVAARRPQSTSANTFGALKQIDAGVLNVGYAELGPAQGGAVVLLHGWPYDIHSYVDVAPLLASAGYRVIVPYLRGYGTTRFLSGDTPRNGQQAALAADTIALMDALAIEKAIVAGFDWGARTANIVSALWPDRCKGTVSVSGYLIGSREANRSPLPPQAELDWWYQYYFSTERGRAGYDKYRYDFAKLIWRTASPQWRFDAATFDRTREGVRQPGSRQPGDAQLPVAARARRRRVEVRRARDAAGGGSCHHGADDHARRRCQRCAASGSGVICQEVRRQVRAPTGDRRRRSQPAAGSAAGLCQGRHRRRRMEQNRGSDASWGNT